MPEFKPFSFSHVNDALLLAAAGYEHQFVKGWVEDIGDAENGPQLDYCPDMHIWSLIDLDRGCAHEIVVVDGMVVEVDVNPLGPEFIDSMLDAAIAPFKLNPTHAII